MSVLASESAGREGRATSPDGKDDSGYFLDVTLNAELNGIDQVQTEALVAKAHTICPYSKRRSSASPRRSSRRRWTSGAP